MSLTPDMMPAWELREHLKDRDASIVILGNEVSRLTAEVERLRAALSKIAVQKKTTELVTATDVEYADFEDGYDMCIDTARAALTPPAQSDDRDPFGPPVGKEEI